MRVLVTGAAGVLGRQLLEVLPGGAVEVIGLDRARLDVGDRDAVLSAITTLHPDAVVHAAAWTAVDDCELDPDTALRVNALGTRYVADGARRVGAHVTYVSTDFVFSGRKDGPYHEWDDPEPLSVYGRSKLGGERELDPSSTVVRTSWVFGRGSPRLEGLLRLADGDGEVRFVDDQQGCPTSAADLAAVIRHLVVARLPGTFHVTNQGATTWHGFAQAVFALAGADPARVVPIATADLDPPRPAARPANSVLDNAALRLSGIPLPPHHREPLERLVKELHV